MEVNGQLQNTHSFILHKYHIMCIEYEVGYTAELVWMPLLPLSGIKTQISGHPASILVTVPSVLPHLQKQVVLKILIFYISFCSIPVANNNIIFCL